MQAVILAAGRGKRLQPLTDDRPKPMVLLNGKPILEHVFERLPEEISEIIIVVGYKREQIKEYFGYSWKGLPIKYCDQEELNGTASSLFCAKDLIQGKFLLLTGDDIQGTEDIQKGLNYDYCLLVAEVEDPSKYGVVEKTEEGNLKSIVEKPKNPPTNLVWTGAMVLSPGIFDTELIQSESGEYYIPDLFKQILEKDTVHLVTQREWNTVTAPEDVEKVEKILQEA